MKLSRHPSLLCLAWAVLFVMFAWGVVDSLVAGGGFGTAEGSEGERVLTFLASLMGLLATVVVWAVWPLLRGTTAPSLAVAEAISASGRGNRGAVTDATAKRCAAYPDAAPAVPIRATSAGPSILQPARVAPSIADHHPLVQAYKAALDQAPAGVLITDRRGRIEYVNDAFVANVGYQRVEVTGRTPRFLGAGRACGEVFRDLWKTVVAGGVWHGEILIRRRNGAECWEKVAVSPLREGSSQISRFVAVCEDVTDHKRREEGLHQLARLDPLTGISNRRHLMERARHEWVRADRFSLPLALIMLDIDHFKKVNDEYGHAVGDRAICAVATICEDSVREIDIVGRYGGEEFVIVLPGTDLDGARKLGRRLRKRIAETVLQDEKGRPFKLTASLGIAELGADVTLERLLILADGALYRAKRAGRNRLASVPAGGRGAAQACSGLQ